jgi:hypothetical protein
MWKVIKDWRMILLLPMFFASNYFYAYVSPAAVPVAEYVSDPAERVYRFSSAPHTRLYSKER